ncbi:XrtA/PEP-CTERM system-associated ATPase [Novosphingobium mangrovi (ex Huang et al. 2023)]|uniref:XrtA-associated ATPase n=1 Tax=Novosphingobium mangrovi (ex Huang et al. 2023) TaxID=2976432 RepID=A0ABT2I591_9SPHN|nr:XrtA/PEP-CTERM system-associated ATPase [Novosphingobium mangrovi (ex Huang et al. 2023)]MCT2399980.1 XrtA-associated ATPase [Novosphingobium mangrovi (ex Huang et al. 2023)]
MFDDFYGLQARPFQLTPDPAFYFESLTHRKALSYLGYGLGQGEGFVVITGEVGSGKSTLVAHLMATVDPSRMTAANVVTSALDGEEIVHVVAQAFGLPVEGHDKASALGAIETFLHEEARAGRRCLLIVDEAQNLTVSALEELRMLSNFQLGSHPLLQTLLLGQPEFRDTLMESDQLEQLRQRVIAAHHLGPMQPQEVQAYIEHRMSCVGWTGNPGFDPGVFAEIHEATGGIPRRINQIVNRLLLLGAVEQRVQIDSAMVQQVLDDMEADGSLALAKNKAPAVSQTEPVAAEAVDAGEVSAVQPVHVDAIDTAAAVALIEAALADRDAQISELQQAVLELANAAEAREAAEGRGNDDQVAALQAQLAEASARADRLEARLDEQEHMLRHTLTMLIEWIEGGDGRREAA